MANALGTLFQNIAAAIRAKTGDTGTMKPAEFPEKIASIPIGGGGDIELLENMEVDVDFSGGNQLLSVPTGYAVKSAILNKPSTLIPSNIAKGVNIAGIVGGLEVGGNSVEYTGYEGTYTNSIFTVTGSATSFRMGSGGFGIMMFSWKDYSNVGMFLLAANDGYEYSAGCQYSSASGWIYDFRIHVGETFEIPHDGNIPSYTTHSCIEMTYEDSAYLEFTGKSKGYAEMVVSTGGGSTTYKIIVG